jgi:predicted Zn-ribbon and HTH transcriptional regulator
MELDRIIQHCLREMEGPGWIAKRVEVIPGVVDSEIIHITPEMDRLYGFVWPDTLVGRRISEIHTLTDAQITRQYALFRHLGFAAPQHYVMHGMHPNGRIFRIIKHVNQQTVGSLTLWVTRHEKWSPSTSLSLLKPVGHQLPQARSIETFLGHANVAEMQLLLQSALQHSDPLVLPQSLLLTSQLTQDPQLLFTHSKIKNEPVQEQAEKISRLAPPPEIELLPEMVCQKCQHTWTPRKSQRPEVCPRCKNPRWWEPRQRQRKKKSDGTGKDS